MPRTKPTQPDQEPDLLVASETDDQQVDQQQGVDAPEPEPEPGRRRIRILPGPTNQGLYYNGKTHSIGSTTGVIPPESSQALVAAGYAEWVDDDEPDEPDQGVDQQQQNGG